jgi:hypothetical protein
MSYQISWLVENRVLLIEGHGEVTLQEMEQQAQDIRRLIAGTKTPIHFVVDLRDLEKVDYDADSAAYIADVLYATISLGWRLLYGNRDITTREMFRTTTRRYGLKTAWVSNQQEALRFLSDVDETLTYSEN